MADNIARFRGRLFNLRCALIQNRTRIGEGLRLYSKLELRGKGSWIIGKNCTVRGMPGSKGEYTTLFTNSPEAVIEIGDNVILLAAKTSCRFAISIGNDVLIEEASLLDTDFHSPEKSRKKIEGESLKSCRIVIGDRTAIGARSIICKGTTIGTDC